MSERERDLNREREPERGWERVRSSKERKERNIERVIGDPHRSQQRNTCGQHYTITNWRDRTEITSYYFTRFSDEVTEQELWKYFKK